MKPEKKWKYRSIVTAALIAGCALPLLVYRGHHVTGRRGGSSSIIRLAGGNAGVPNPFGSITPGTSTHTDMIFDGLLESDETGIIPWLAERWEISDDYRAYTFHLRTGVQWHDGQPFSARDVAFTFNYLRDHADVRNALLVNGQFIITSARAVDETTVTITVDAPSRLHLEKIGFTAILPRHIWNDVTDPLTIPAEKATVGTGPFRFVSFSTHQGTYRLEAFPEFWGPKARVATVEWVPVGDQIIAFESGEIDLISVGPDLAARYRNNPEFTVSRGRSMSGCRLVFNYRQRPELRDKNLRKAFAYGTDREEMVRKIARGAGGVGTAGSVPSDHPFYNPVAAPYPFDPEKARKLLGGREYTFDILARNNMDEVKVAELMKISLERIGIHLIVRSMDGKSRNQVLHGGRYDLALFKSGFSGDADYLRTSYGAPRSGDNVRGNISGYYNDTLYHLGLQSLHEMDGLRRREILDAMQVIIADEVPEIILYTIIENHVYRPARFNHWKFRFDRIRSPSDLYKMSFLEDRRK